MITSVLEGMMIAFMLVLSYGAFLIVMDSEKKLDKKRKGSYNKVTKGEMNE